MEPRTGTSRGGMRIGFLALALAAPAAAQRLSSETQLSASDAAAGDSFGWDVDLAQDGTRAVVAAIGDDGAASGAGSVYVFTRSGTSWLEEVELFAADAAANDFFGQSVAVDGSADRLVAGSIFDDDLGLSSGAAYVFARSGTSWTQEAKLVAATGASGDETGDSVAIDDAGVRVLVGSPKDDTLGLDAGAARVFARSGTSWVEEALLLAPDGAAGDDFGGSVAFDASGTRALIGAVNHDSAGFNAGAAYVFTRSGTVWTFEAKLTAADAAPSDFLGTSVALCSQADVAVLGAVGDDDAAPNGGSAYVFRRSGTIWTEESELHANVAATDDFFGGDVGVNAAGDSVLIGAPRADTGAGADAGSLYLFRFTGGAWGLDKVLTRGGAAAGDQYGGAVAFDASGDLAIAGAATASLGGSASVLETDPLEVPAEYATIQGAISAAADGEEVLVAPGTYLENVSFLGKTLCLRSSAGKGATILFGDGTTRVVTMGPGVGDAALFEGFTVTGGGIGPGAGMRITSGTSPTVRDCRFASNTSASRGGGLEVDGASSPLIEDCTFDLNSAVRGGGISVGPSSTPRFERCTSAKNAASVGGAGLYCGFLANPTLLACTFGQNNALGGEGGGALLDAASTVTFASCVFLGNSADLGGALRTLGSASVTLSACTVESNIAVIDVGGLSNAGGTVSVGSCIVRGNRHAGVVVVGSQVSDGGGSGSTVDWCDIEGGWSGPGAGNFDADPLYVDFSGGNLRLRVGSPCTDRGDNADLLPGLDAVDRGGLPRRLDDPDTPDAGSGTAPIVDVGAYEFGPSCGPYGAPVTYCTAKLNSLGCTPTITFTGSASLTDPNPFDIHAINVLNFKNGLFFYGLNGRLVNPLLGGTLCMVPPLRRTGIQNAGGNSFPPSDCSGVFTFDFNAWLQSGIDVLLVPGQVVQGQYWTRDPPDPFQAGLTNAIEFQICP